jgi:hypothetical protein
MTDATKPIQPLSFSESQKKSTKKSPTTATSRSWWFFILFYSVSEITKK